MHRSLNITHKHISIIVICNYSIITTTTRNYLNLKDLRLCRLRVQCRRI